MRDLLVVVLTVTGTRITAGLGEVDRPGRLLREAVVARPAGAGEDLSAAVADVLHRLDAGALPDRLLALAVALAVDAGPGGPALRRALGSELPEGWGLPATLPVVHGSAERWADDAAVADAPLVAGAVVAAARAVGAHAHLPRG